MPFIPWIIILAGALENSIPFLIGLIQTPKGAVFLGTVHHPSDYFYYVSQFAQGASRWMTTLDLYTSEPIKPSFVGWSNVLIGRIFSVFSISPIYTYQIAIFFITIFLLIASYKFARSVLENTNQATTALFLFVISHAFPLLRDGKASYGDYFNNFAVPRVRFGAVPHQLLLACASICMSYLFIQWIQKQKNHSINLYIFLMICSVTLASLQPVLWALMMLVMGITAISFLLIYKDVKHLMSTFSKPIALMGFSGIFPALYLSNLFQTVPFVQLKSWEALQHTQFTVNYFISATGPIFVIAILSIPWLLAKRSFSSLYIFLFTILSFVLFLSPIPTLLEVTHVRFMSTFTILCLSIIASIGIHKFSSFLESSTRTLIRSKFLIRKQYLVSLILASIVLYLLPNHILSISLASDFSSTNAYHYLVRGDYDLLVKAAKTSTPDDTFLVIWPYNAIFPALSGRRSFNGHTLLTINPVQKDAEAVQFFDRKITDEEAKAFIMKNHISRIIVYSWSVLPAGLATKIETQGSISLYKVNTEYLKPYSK